MRQVRLLAFAALSSLLFTQCGDRHGQSDEYAFGEGLYIGNEGLFTGGTGSITYQGEGVVAADTLVQDAFYQVNGRVLGGVLNDLALDGESLYAVMNVGASLEVMDVNTMVAELTVLGFGSPRCALPQPQFNRVLVSDWGNNHVMVVDLATSSITDSVATGVGPEGMMAHNGHIYVANNGAYGLDSTVSIYDAQDLALVSTVVVGDKPQSFAVDYRGHVWVLCQGFTSWTDPSLNTAGGLVRLDNQFNVVESIMGDDASVDHPSRLLEDLTGDNLYFLSNGYGGYPVKVDVHNPTYPESALISKTAYGLGYHLGHLYLLDAKDYASPGAAYIYTTDGQLADSLVTGIVPTAIVFTD